MKERYINNKLSNIKIEREEIETDKDSISTITLLGSIGLGTLGIVALFGFPVFGVSALIGSGVCLLGKYKNKYLNEAVLKRLDNEEKHLEKINNETPMKKTELNKKRVNKIISLKELGNSMEDNYKHAATFNGISLLITTAGIAGSFVNPIFALVGVAGLGLDVVASKKMVDYRNKSENIKNRINNIDNDIEVINNEDRDLDENRISEKRKIKEEDKNISKQHTANEQLVDEYMKNLEIKEEEEKTKTKVKK